MTTRLWIGGNDWGHIDCDWDETTRDEWNEQVAPGRYIFELQLVDEGTVRLLTLLRTTAHARPPAAEPWFRGPDGSWVGIIFTAVYIDIRGVPAFILRRFHP